MGKRQRKGYTPEVSVIHSEQLFIKSNNDTRHNPLKARTAAQTEYIRQIATKDIVFASGCAGTGKTYVAVGMACEALESGDIDKIVVSRPVVPCDEELGTLPGELEDKYQPWIAPIMDVFEQHMGVSQLKYAIKHKAVDPQPLMYMRGKTFNKSWMLLDEAQNTSPPQMMMFLTRMGKGSKVIINGDMDQHDRYDSRGNVLVSGLQDAIDRLCEIPEIGLCGFNKGDQLRHKLVGKILTCYDTEGE